MRRVINNTHHHPLLLILLLFFYLTPSFGLEIREDDIIGRREELYFYGDKVLNNNAWKRSSDGRVVEFSAVQESILSLDSFLDYEKIMLPKEIDSIQIVLSPSSKDTLFPTHVPFFHFYQHVNHTQLTNFINDLFLSSSSSSSSSSEVAKELNTARMATLREDVTPIYNHYLPSDPFTSRKEKATVGYLKISSPSSQYTSEQSVTNQNNNNNFISLFFPWFSRVNLPITKTITTQISMKISRCSAEELLQVLDKSHSGKIVRISFSETGKVNGPPSTLPITAPETPNYKFAVYYFSKSDSNQITLLNTFELDEGKFVEKEEERVRIGSNADWKVNMRRSIEKQGYHRDLVTDLIISGEPNQECHVILVEYHTHDVYVDFDQLSEYERFGGPPFVLFEYVDVEVTAFNPVASHFVLFVKKSFTTGKDVQVNVTIPIHMRYQQPQYNALDLPVYISPPDVYIQCNANLQPAQSSKRDLPFSTMETSISGVSLTHEGNPVLTVRVPTGKLEDIGLVSWGTVIATWGALLFILYEIFWKSSPAIKTD